MACKTHIEKDLRKKIEDASAEGLGKSLPLAKKIADRVNKAYGSKVVEFNESGDFIDRTVNVPNSLIDHYHTNELKIEEQERLSKARAGDQLRLFQLESGNPKEVAEKTLTKVKDFLNRVDVKWSEANNLGNAGNDKILGIADILAKTIDVVQGAKGQHALPEESMHFIVQALKQKFPDLYKELDKDINRYQLYQTTLDGYRDVYKTAEGRPDFPRIREEAITKLLTGMVINDDLEETGARINTAKNWWAKAWDSFKSLFSKITGNPFVDKFEDLAKKVYKEGFILPEDIKNLSQALKYMQTEKAEPEKQEKLFKFMKSLMDSGKYKKVQEGEGEDQVRYYEINGIKYHTSVTDAVKERMQRESNFGPRGEAWKQKDEYSKLWGTAIDDDLTGIISRLTDPETGKLLSAPVLYTNMNEVEQEAHIRNSSLGKMEKALFDHATVRRDKMEMYKTLENFAHEFLKSFPEDTRFMTQVIVADPNAKRVLPGTMDFLAIHPDASISIYDWKSLDSEYWDLEDGALKQKQDVAWFKQKQWDMQLSHYKNIITRKGSVYQNLLETKVAGRNPEPFNLHTVETRAIPIATKFIRRKIDVMQKAWTGNTLYDLDSIQIGSPGWNDSWRVLKPVPTKDEKTANDQLNNLISNIDKIYNDLFGQRFGSKLDREAKFRELERLIQAKRDIQVNQHVGSTVNTLVLTVNRLNKELLNADFGTIRRNIDTLTSLDGVKKTIDSAFEPLKERRAKLEAELAKAPDTTKDAIKNALKDLEEQELVYGKLGDVDRNITTLLNQYRSKAKEGLQTLSDTWGIRNFFTVQRQINPWDSAKYFNGKSENFIKAVQLYNRLSHDADGRTKDEFRDKFREGDGIRTELDTWAKGQGIKLQDALNKLLSKKTLEGKELKFLPKIQREFYDARDAAVDQLKSKADMSKGAEWFSKNVDFDRTGFEAYKLKRLASIEKEEFAIDPAENAEARKAAKEAFLENWDPAYKTAEGTPTLKAYQNRNNWFITPKESWKTEEYKTMESTPALKKAYEYFRGIIKDTEDAGLLDGWLKNRNLPFVQEKAPWAMETLPGRLAMGFLDTFYAGDRNLYRTDELNRPVFEIKPNYTNDLGVWKVDDEGKRYKDYGHVSKDLFTVFSKFAESSITSKHMSEIEDASHLILDFEEAKGETLQTTRFGNIIEDNYGLPKPVGLDSHANENAKLLKTIMFRDLYGYSDAEDVALGTKSPLGPTVSRWISKIPGGTEFIEDVAAGERHLSLRKILTGMDTYVQLQGMGFNWKTAVANLTHGLTVLGFDHRPSDLLPPVTKDSWTKFHALSDYFSTDMGDAARTADTNTFKKVAFYAMRKTDEAVQHAGLIAHLRNSTIVEGKLKDISTYVKNEMSFNVGDKAVKFADRLDLSDDERKELTTKAFNEIDRLRNSQTLLDLVKVEDGKATLPGVEPNSADTRTFRDKVQQSIQAALGAVPQNDMYLMKLHWATNLLMTFRGRLPRLFRERFGEFHENTNLGAKTIGKFALIKGRAAVDGTARTIFQTSLDVLGRNAFINNMKAMEKYGTEAHIQDLYNHYELSLVKTGKVSSLAQARAEMPTIEEFRNMYARKMISSVRELRFIGSVFALASIGVFNSKDDPEGWLSIMFNTALRKEMERIEFYFPAASGQILKDILPLTGVVNDLWDFMKHTAKYFIDDLRTDDEDKATEGKKAIKYGARSVPFFRPGIDVYATFDPDFRTEYNVHPK